MSERTDPETAEAAQPNADDASVEAGSEGAPEAPRRFWQLPVQRALQQAWTDAKQASQGFEDELRKRARSLMDRSGVTQGSEDVQRVVGELRERLQKGRQEFEQKLHGSVQSAIERVQQPLVAEIAALKDRAEALGERVSALRPGAKAEAEAEPKTQEASADADAAGDAASDASDAPNSAT
jgi:polyhydroxyalkanoate synthesis regulator phasin